MTKKTIQAKHLTDETFLLVLSALVLTDRHDNPLHGSFQTKTVLKLYHTIPPRIVRAKLRSLERRDLVFDLCSDMCGEEYILTDPGIELFYEIQNIYQPTSEDEKND